MNTSPEGVDRNRLDRSFAHGLAWTAGAKWVSQLVAWPSVLIAANLLSPYDFGVVEMAGVYFVVANVIAEFGIGMAVLQLPELEASVVGQISSVATLFGLVAMAASFGAAPLLARFFHAPELKSLVWVTSVTFILTGLESVPLALLQKDMDYKRLSLAESIQAIATALTCIACAYSGLGYWSLIAGNLGGRLVAVTLLCYWKPTPFRFPRRSQVGEPLRFGIEVAAQRVSGSIVGMADSIVVGRTLGQSSVGVYRIASNLAYTPVEKVGSLLMRVTGPLFARVQSDKALTLRYYLLLTEGLAMILLPLAFGLALVAPEAVQSLLGAKWQSAIEPLRWLSVFGGLRGLNYINGQVLTSQRKTRWAMQNSIIGFVLMPTAFWISSRWGVTAVALSWLAMSPVTIVAPMVKTLRALECSIAKYLNALLPACAGSALMAVAVLLAARIPGVVEWSARGRLALYIGLGALVYVAVLLLVFGGRVRHYYHFVLKLRRDGASGVEA